MPSLRRTGIACLLLTLSRAGMSAQETQRPFPYALGAEDGIHVAAAAGSFLIGEWLVGRLEPVTFDDVAGQGPSDVPFFDRYATRQWSEAWNTASDVTRDVVWIATAGVVLGPRSWHDSNGWTLAVMAGEAFLLTQGVTQSFKSTGRERPYTYNEGLSEAERFAIADARQDAKLSFFSGHTSTAFVAATFASTVFEDVYGESPWSRALWIGSLGLAGATAVARVEAGKHFPSDVLAGAAVGSAIGILVPHLHRRREDDRSRRPDVVLAPSGVGIRIPSR